MKISLTEEQKEKYSPRVEDIAACVDASKQEFTSFGTILEHGSRRLWEGMDNWILIDKMPQYDPDDRYDLYDAKDLYFIASNAICDRSLWRIPKEWHQEAWLRGNPLLLNAMVDLTMMLSELYFVAMLEAVKRCQDHNATGKHYNFNKGMVYANLGVAQAAQMKLDEGFANILKALDEDRGYLGQTPENSQLNRELYTQFTERYVMMQFRDYLDRLNDTSLGDPAAFANEFIAQLDYDNRVFFEFTFAKIIRSLEIWRDKENRFTSNRLFAYLQDLCLFAEDLLRRKGYLGNALGDLVRQAFSMTLTGCHASDLGELNGRLCAHFNKTNPEDRSLSVLYTIRNFSSHNITGGTSNDFLYAKYEEVLLEIIRALVMIHNKQAASAQP